MLSLLKEYAGKKQLLGFITTNNGQSFGIFVVDSITKQLWATYLYKIEDIQTFMNEIQEFKNVFKAIIIDLFRLELDKTPYLLSYEFCRELKEKLQELNIPNYFMSEDNYFYANLIIAAQIDVDFDDTVLVVLSFRSLTQKSSFQLTVAELKFTPDGYELIKQTETPDLNVKEKPEILFRQICAGFTPSKNVIVSAFHFKKVPFKKIFKSVPKVVVLNNELHCYHTNFIVETCKWLLDKSEIKYHVLPFADRSIHIYGNYGSDKNILDILKIEMNEPLPIYRTTMFTKSLPFLHTFVKNTTLKYETRKELPSDDAHAFEVTVTIDEENFDDIKVASLGHKKIEKLPDKFDTLLKPKIPVIGLFDNSSFISLCKNDSEGYEFLEEWGGMFGTDCFISFDQKKQKYGESAKEILQTKHTFVVFDLLKIMSMPTNDIEISKTWGFTITKDSDHPVLLEFDNFDGTKKRASPEFLMALFLRQHFKAIETEIGEKPKNIAFWILKKKFTEAENQRIKEGLEESCKLLKVDCRFIDVEDFEFDFDEFI